MSSVTTVSPISADKAQFKKPFVLLGGAALVILFATVVIAIAHIGLSVGLAWLVRLIFPLDVFQSTIICLVALAAAASIVIGVIRQMLATLQPDSASPEDEESDDAMEAEVVSSQAPRSRIRELIAVIESDDVTYSQGGRRRRSKHVRRR